MSDSQTMQVFIPSSVPIVSSISIDSLMGSFDDDLFDKSESSHIRHVVEALCGEAGTTICIRHDPTACAAMMTAVRCPPGMS